jgi:putative flippase GtrA
MSATSSPLRSALPPVAAWCWRHAVRAAAFAGVSGAGLILDLSLFALLMDHGASARSASLASGAAATALVYFASVRRIFHCRSDFLLGLFAVYLAWQGFSVAASAFAVGGLTAGGVAPLLAKLLILPVTFPANYLFMSVLTARWNARARAAA